MARARHRRAVKRHRDLVWITTIIDASLLESTPTDIGQIVLASDWSAGNSGFDRATLLGIRGWLSLTQSAISTAGENTGAFLAMYLTDGQVAANSMDPSTATEYGIFDTIWTCGMGLNGSGFTVTPSSLSTQLDIKSKRKMTSATDVRLAMVVAGADTGAPRVGALGCVRALLMLDPP